MKIICYLFFTLLAFIFYLFYYLIKTYFLIDKLTISELLNINWQISMEYENLSKKQKKYLGWAFIFILKKINKRIDSI